MTSKENQLAKEMVGLIKNIEEHTDQFSSGERIPQLELEIIVSKIESLYEKSVILKYLHAHIDDIRGDFSEVTEKAQPEKEVVPLVEAQVSHQEPSEEKKSLHEKIASAKAAKTLAEKLQGKSIKNLTSSVSLHEKLMFQKELFNGKASEYNHMIQHLETLQSIGEAKKYLEENFAARYDWEKKKEAWNALTSLLEKRYRD